MKGLKALVIQAPYETDMGEILQIARAESMRIFHHANKIKVLELIAFRHGWVAIVQNNEVAQTSSVESEGSVKKAA